jgi:branched-chain amino acid transport system substrate-binding protein
MPLFQFLSRSPSRLSLALLMSILTCASQAQDGVTRATVAIGQTTALTGSASALALPFQQGAKLYFDRINAAGGVNGRSLNLISVDDAGNPATSKSNAVKLIKDGVLLMFGTFGSAQTTAANEALKNTDVLLFAPMAAADELRGVNFPNVYALRPGYSEEAAAIVRHAETLGMRKLAIVHAQDADSLSAAEAAERTMTSLGANLVHKTGTNSLPKALAALPQSLLVISDPQSASVVIKEARTSGFRGPIYGFSNTGESLLAEQLGAAGAGVVLARVTPRSDNAKSVIVRELSQDAAAAKLGKPNVYMLEGYIAARALAEALRRTGKDVNRARFKKALEGISEWDMGGFRVSFDRDRTGSKLVELSLIDSSGKVRE